MKRPNLIFIMPDQFRQQCINFMDDSDPVITPNLDKLCGESMVLENALSNYPMCSPYRGMLFTGKYPYSTGIIANCNSRRNAYGVYLKKTERCFSDILSENGYDLGYIGKWHLDPTDPTQEDFTEGYRDGVMWDTYTLPSRRHGFNFWYSYGACDRHLTPHYWVNNAELHEKTIINEWSVKHETNVAVRYIKNESGERDERKPFALVMAYNPPHPPYNEVPQKYKDMYEGKGNLLTRENATNHANEHVKNYFAAVTGVDENVGRVLSALDEQGIADDTIVVFTSDHGDMMGSHGLMGKPHWYNESFKVPFVIRYPRKIKPGKSDFILNVPDIMPSLLVMMGLGDKIPSDVEGLDKTAYFYGDAKGETTGLYMDVLANVRGLKTKRYTFVVKKNYVEDEEYILFDDKNDPFQLNNIAESNMDVVKGLRDDLAKYIKATKDVWDL